MLVTVGVGVSVGVSEGVAVGVNVAQWLPATQAALNTGTHPRLHTPLLGS